ncbi:phosphomannomutase/phosphoglucomutase [Thalassomonas actiniarum]|uniref:phosphomannomutase n=1 Tax=Thalassomonas actiniarum TaxID=485447 RepID=A0AAF0C2X0_9GAMM|nr:phosphomannomutase/phosphoglucomutase [Thalassomonas actiniarum]WDD98290.1 phosphomannomutase/phosphoglucomutase [Thalassomonas actiniarum]
MQPLTCFKAYDIRGKVPDELNPQLAYKIGRATALFLNARKIVVGHDIRLSSPMITEALIDGLTDGGADVFNIGQCGTEEVYFATFSREFCGGICVTASHNPKAYNGMKFVREGAAPISGDTGLNAIKELVQAESFSPPAPKGKEQGKGQVMPLDISVDYTRHLLGYIDIAKLKKLKIVVNAGNGGAGAIIDRLAPHLPFEFIPLNHEPDGNFPNGVPNPLLPENRTETVAAIKLHNADLGIAWDGDFDRCFFFDEQGEFIEGYYIVGLLAAMLLDGKQDETVIHDPRLYWNTLDIVRQQGGKALVSKTGHAFIKEAMREQNAIYGGEMSAHHYFRDFAYCDNGNIPWLLITALMSRTGQSLSSLINERKALYPCSGEINSQVKDPQQVIRAIAGKYQAQAKDSDITDGLSMSFQNWRFNLRMSNTEPVLRLNVEAKNDQRLMQEKTKELLMLIKSI